MVWAQANDPAATGVWILLYQAPIKCLCSIGHRVPADGTSVAAALNLERDKECSAQAGPAVRVLQGYGCSVNLVGEALSAGVVCCYRGPHTPVAGASHRRQHGAPVAAASAGSAGLM